MRTPRHSTVVAYLALLVALGGSAYAATQVTSAQIKNGAVKSADLKNKGVKLKDLNPKTIAALRAQEPDPSEIPARTLVLSATGSPVANGDKLTAALAAIAGASAQTPWTVVLGPGRYAVDAANETFTVPSFVTLVGDGPLTVVETTAATSFRPVLDISPNSVVRSVNVQNPSTTVGAAGIGGTDAIGSLIDDVVVTARQGIVIEGSRLRDSTVLATADAVRIEPAPGRSEVRDVTIDVTASASGSGVLANGSALLDGVVASVTAGNTGNGLFVVAASGLVEVRDSSFRGAGSTAGNGVFVNPPAASTVLTLVDGSRLQGVADTGTGLKTDGSGAITRVGGSMIGGSPSVDELEVADARCINSYDAGYVNAVDC